MTVICLTTSLCHVESDESEFGQIVTMCQCLSRKDKELYPDTKVKLISSNLCSLSLCRSTEPKQRQAVLGWLGQSRHGEMQRYRRLPPTHKVRTMPIWMNARVTNLKWYLMFPSHYVGGFRTGRNTTKQSQIRSQVQRSPLLTRGDFAPRSN